MESKMLTIGKEYFLICEGRGNCELHGAAIVASGKLIEKGKHDSRSTFYCFEVDDRVSGGGVEYSSPDMIGINIFLDRVSAKSALLYRLNKSIAGVLGDPK